MKSIIELRAEADMECQKADELAITGWESDGRFTVAFPNIALAYFGRAEELREQAFQMEMGNIAQVLRVLGRGIK